MDKAALTEAEIEWSKGAANALSTPEAVAEWYSKPQNSQQAATPEQIEAWRRAGGSFPASVLAVFGALWP